MVCEDVVSIVVTPDPLFFIMYTLPALPTAVGSVTVNVPEVQSMKKSPSPIEYVLVLATYGKVLPPSEISPSLITKLFAIFPFYFHLFTHVGG